MGGVGEFGAGGVGVAALDGPNGFGCADFDGGCRDDVDVARHGGVGVEEGLALGAVMLEGGKEAFGVGGGLEVAMLLEGGDGECVGGELLTLGGTVGDKPLSHFGKQHFKGIGSGLATQKPSLALPTVPEK
jgi:hypothetical protein